MTAFHNDWELHIATGSPSAIMRGGARIPGNLPENYQKPRKTRKTKLTGSSEYTPAGTATADGESYMRALQNDSALPSAKGSICAIVRGGPQMLLKVPEIYQIPGKHENPGKTRPTSLPESCGLSRT